MNNTHLQRSFGWSDDVLGQRRSEKATVPCAGLQISRHGEGERSDRQQAFLNGPVKVSVWKNLAFYMELQLTQSDWLPEPMT